MSRVNDKLAATTRYYYDGVNEIVETDAAGNPANQRSYVHGVSYVDERLMMLKQTGTARPYYYVLDRMYCVWLVLDRAGAVVERYAYDEYGRPLIRESAGRGDLDDDTDLDAADLLRVSAAQRGTIWDPRADLDDDGDVDATDTTLYATKDDAWPPQSTSTTVAQAFSDVGNPFGFQGRVHFALDTIANATDGKLMLVDHRNRMNDPVTGRWITRDPIEYKGGSLNLYEYIDSNAIGGLDPLGRRPLTCPKCGGPITSKLHACLLCGWDAGPWWPLCCHLLYNVCVLERSVFYPGDPLGNQCLCLRAYYNCIQIKIANPCHAFDSACLSCAAFAHGFHIPGG